MLAFHLLFTLSLAAAAAAQADPQEATLEEAMAACLGISDRSSRLECFDSLAKAVEKIEEMEKKAAGERSETVLAPEPGEPSTPPREATIVPKAPSPAPEASAAPAVSDDDKKFLIIPKSDPRAKTVRQPFTAEILKAWLRYDKIYLALDNGEIWKQTSRNRPQLPKDGEKVEFTKGILGGWFAQFESGSSKYSFALVE